MTTLTKIARHRELRKKLLFTAIIFLFYRMLAHVPVAGVDLDRLRPILEGSQFLGLANIFSGGTLANFSVVAIGISPFITASIIMQLATMLFPTLKEIQKDGEAGREKINQYTRLLSVPMAVIQSLSVLALLNSQSLLMDSSPLTVIVMITSLIAGAMIVMWLGELITMEGIGNGISMVLLAGIISQVPTTLQQFRFSDVGQHLTTIGVFATVFLVVIGLVVFMNEAVRKVDIQYAKRTRGSRTYGGHRSHLPIRVNVAGVMPIIFAVSILLAPPFIGRMLAGSDREEFWTLGQNLVSWFSQTSPVYMTVYFVVVFVFTYFSALVFFNTEDISDELKKSGAFIQGIRPGSPTKKYLDFVVTRITLAGAIFLGVVAILPSMAQLFTGLGSLAIGGTSLLIVVSVILDTAKQVDSMLVGQSYDQYT